MSMILRVMITASDLFKRVKVYPVIVSQGGRMVDGDYIPELAVAVTRRQVSERKAFIVRAKSEIDIREDGIGCQRAR